LTTQDVFLKQKTGLPDKNGKPVFKFPVAITVFNDWLGILALAVCCQ
jgi:hypothetical protein